LQKPFLPAQSGREDAHEHKSIGQVMGGQHRARQAELVLLRQRQGMEEMEAAFRNVALREPLEKNLGSNRVLSNQGRGSGKQEDRAITRMRLHRTLGELQELRCPARICNDQAEDILPPAPAFLRLIAEGQRHLPCGSVSHANCGGLPCGGPDQDESAARW
jgi:hypothetical protein